MRVSKAVPKAVALEIPVDLRVEGIRKVQTCGLAKACSRSGAQGFKV